MRLDEIDGNFKLETKLDLPGLSFASVLDEPFRLYGVTHNGREFVRMPDDVARTVSSEVHLLSGNTAGGRVKFRTNSSYVAIKAVSPLHIMPHMAPTGSSGFDLYVGRREVYCGSFHPSPSSPEGFESKVSFGDRSIREITINFPLYTRVRELYIGLESDATVLPTAGYRYEKPIVFYGSSITQGGCASRPGNSYEAHVSRALGANYLNLGFSGSAKGEIEMADYVAELDMSVFVYDYDHNAPSPEYLEKTHERMFRVIREKNPELLIVILSRPRYRQDDDVRQRLEVVKRTYDNAIARSDENVYFISGKELMRYAKNDGTVDGVHPNDLGFYSMARVLTPVLRKILKGI